MNNKMKVEVWSDIACPFCYIGKRNYEGALKEFAGRGDVEIVWKSFQLDPSIDEDASKNKDVYQYLSERKGISRERVVQMHGQVTEMAKDAGLEYHLDKSIMANSFKAHRLIQKAKEKGLGDAAEERFFHAYFTEGKDISDMAVLRQLGLETGLQEADIDEALRNEYYAQQVMKDINEAQMIGVNGVPFFVFDRKYAVSGAQPKGSFLQVLEKSHGEWKKENPTISLDVAEGPTCTTDGECA